jgi:hypothetical protein
MCGFTSINEMCDNCIGVGGGGGGLQWEIWKRKTNVTLNKREGLPKQTLHTKCYC